MRVKKSPTCNGFDLHVADLVDEQTVRSEIFFEDFGFGVIGDGLVEFAHQFGKEDVTTAVTVVDSVNEEAGGESGLAASSGPQPDDVFGVVHVAYGVVEGHDLLLVELGLALEGKGFDDEGFCNAGLLEAEPTCVFAFDAVFFINDVAQEPVVGKRSFWPASLRY